MALATTDEEYYENPEHFGEGQDITLENVIDNILVPAGDDSIFKKEQRSSALIHGKMWLKKFHLTIKPEKKAIAIDVGPSRTFPFPRYMSNWHNVFVIDKCDRLRELNVNSTPAIQDYLQYDDFNLVFDNDGNVLEGSEILLDTKKCEFKICRDNPCYTETCKDPEPMDAYDNSWVRENRSGKYFEFSNDLIEKSVVIVFSTFGLDKIAGCDIKIPNVAEEAITRWIQWRLIEDQHNMPAWRIAYYHGLYKVERDKVATHLSDKITVNQILNSMTLRYR